MSHSRPGVFHHDPHHHPHHPRHPHHSHPVVIVSPPRHSAEVVIVPARPAPRPGKMYLECCTIL